MPKRKSSKRSKKTEMGETVDSDGSEMTNSNEEHTVTETPSKKLIMDFDSDQLFDKMNDTHGNDYIELLKYLYAFGKRDNRPALWSPVQKILKNLSGEGNRNRGSYRSSYNNRGNSNGNRNSNGNSYNGNRVGYNGNRSGYNGGRESYQGNREDFQGGRRGYNRNGNGYNGGHNRGRNGNGYRGRGRGRGGYRSGNRNYQQSEYGQHDTGVHRTDHIDNMETPELHD